MSVGAIFVAWFLGLLCGVAMAASVPYRRALLGYLCMVAGLSFFDIRGVGWLLDMLILVGAVLLCFGVSGGLIEMIWPERKGKDGKGAV